MHFRLRHLNTGRLIVMQELNRGDQKILTVGLSEHLTVDISIHSKGLSSKCLLTSNNPDYMESLEENSVFRLVSTGVDMESGITSNTSVQIQHVASRRFLQHAHNFKFEVAKEDNPDEEGQDG